MLRGSHPEIEPGMSTAAVAGVAAGLFLFVAAAGDDEWRLCGCGCCCRRRRRVAIMFGARRTSEVSNGAVKEENARAPQVRSSGGRSSPLPDEELAKV